MDLSLGSGLETGQGIMTRTGAAPGYFFDFKNDLRKPSLL
jgi:hypothetical protein